jgi:hypothetical protein
LIGWSMSICQSCTRPGSLTVGAARSCRLVDVDLPKLYSAWKPDRGRRSIVRELTDGERAAVGARVRELHNWLTPLASERKAIQAAISAMLVGFRSMRQCQEAAEAVSAIATHNLRKFPLWAVRRGCELISQGEVKGLDRHWPPNDTEIYAIVAAQVNCPRADLDRAEALLAAPVEAPPEPENRPTRAEIEAELGRPIGNGVKAWIEPPRPLARQNLPVPINKFLARSSKQESRPLTTCETATLRSTAPRPLISIEKGPSTMAAKDLPTTVTKVTYRDAQTRGRMRLWKRALARDYQTFDRAYRSPIVLAMVADFAKRSSAKGRRRAFDKIHRSYGPGVTLEGLRLDGNHPLAVWSILKPRDAVTVDAPIESGKAQNCVTVNYVVAGMLGNPRADCGEGLWTLEVPDHAIGRAISAGMQPSAIITEAHHNLLQLAATAIAPDGSGNCEHRFLVKAGSGGFICHIAIGEDISLNGDFCAHVRADTWITEGMLHSDQTLLVGNGKPGERLGDSYLLPAPFRLAALRRFVEANLTVKPHVSTAAPFGFATVIRSCLSPSRRGGASRERGGIESADRRLRHAVGSREIGLRSAFRKPLDGFSALVSIESRGTTKTHATGFGAVSAVAGAGEDQLALKLGQTTEDRQHRPTVRGRRIGPGIGQRLEASTGLADRIEYIQEVASRSGQPIEPRYHQHVTCLQALEHLAELGAVGFRARDLLAENLGAAGSRQLRILGRQGLPVRRHPRIAVNRHFSLQLLKATYALKYQRRINVNQIMHNL